MSARGPGGLYPQHMQVMAQNISKKKTKPKNKKTQSLKGENINTVLNIPFRWLTCMPKCLIQIYLYMYLYSMFYFIVGSITNLQSIIKCHLS